MANLRFVTAATAFWLLANPFLALAAQAPAETSAEERKSFEAMFGKGPQEEDLYRTDRLLLTATGSLKPVHLAPSVASVITKEDIQAMGATTLDEALETVPGLHVEPSGTAYFSSIYSIRGLHTALNPQVLLLVNGIPVTYYNGSRPIAFKMTTTMISRIEIVRGPGSALHGADAFSGTINVITMDNFEIDGTRAGVRYGSFDTVNTWLQQGGQYGGWDLALGVEWQKSSGDPDRVVERDAVWFAPFNAPARSNAPAALDTAFETLDSHLNLRRGDWNLHLFGTMQSDAGGPGAAQAITFDNDARGKTLLADLTYSNDHTLEDWVLTTRLFSETISVDNVVTFYPASVAPPSGQIGNPLLDSQDGGLEVSAVYQGADHQLRLGAGYKNYDFEPDQYKNFNLPARLGYRQCVPQANVYSATLTHITDPECRYMPSANRNLWYLLAQDEWQLAPKWALTVGARYDEYSDFGSTVNPRAALVWETRYDLTTKLMYGTAFRAPSFAEQYAKNNPVTVGNPNLTPEEMQTGELAFDYQPTRNLRLILNLFTYQASELIEPTPALPTPQFTNHGTVEGDGFEIETDWRLTPSLQVRANFAFQRTKNTQIDALVANAPGRQFYMNPHWEFMPDWSLDGQFYWIADRHRAQGDPRSDINDYELVNLTLRRVNIARHWEAALAVRNLFDEDARIPSPYAPGVVGGAFIPNDYPMETRAVWAEVSCHF